MAKGPLFTKKEDAQILREVSKHPENIYKCFIAISKRTGRSVESIKRRYYHYIKPKYQGTLITGKGFCLNGQKEFNPLIKNIPENRKYLREYQTPVKKSKVRAIWDFIISILSE